MVDPVLPETGVGGTRLTRVSAVDVDEYASRVVSLRQQPRV